MSIDMPMLLRLINSQKSSIVRNENDVKNIEHGIVVIKCILPNFNNIPKFVNELIITEAGYTNNLPVIPAFIEKLRIIDDTLTTSPLFAKDSQLKHLEPTKDRIKYLPNDFAKILPNLTYLYCPRHLKELPVLPMSLVEININKYINNWHWLTPNIRAVYPGYGHPLYEEYVTKGLNMLRVEYCYSSVTKRAFRFSHSHY